MPYHWGLQVRQFALHARGSQLMRWLQLGLTGTLTISGVGLAIYAVSSFSATITWDLHTTSLRFLCCDAH